MALGPNNGKTIKLYFSQNIEELKNLQNYSDPFNLADFLESFEYEFNGSDEGVFRVKMNLLNPGLEFEKKFLKYYTLIHQKDRTPETASFDGINSLNFFFRWGYGTEVEEGLSRIICATLSKINYQINSRTEKMMALEFIDNYSFSLKDIATQAGTRTVVLKNVNCLDTQSKLKPVGEVASEVLGGLLNGFEKTIPVVNLYGGSKLGPLLDDLHYLLAAKLASSDIETPNTIEAVKKSGLNFNNVIESQYFLQTLSKQDKKNLEQYQNKTIDLRAINPVWDDFVIKQSPGTIHLLLAYRLMMEELGINFSFGVKKKDISLSSVNHPIVLDIFEGMNTLLGSLYDVRVAQPSESLDIEIKGMVISPDFLEVFGDVNELVNSASSVIFHPSMIDVRDNGEKFIKFRPSFLKPKWDEPNLLRDGNHKNQAKIFTEEGIGWRYYSNSEHTHVIRLSNNTIDKLNKLTAAYGVKVEESKQQVEKDNPNLYKGKKFIDESKSVTTFDSVYAEASLVKGEEEELKEVLQRFITNINSLLSPFINEEQEELTTTYLSVASLTDSERLKLTGRTSIPFKNNDSVLLVGTKKNFLECFNVQSLDFISSDYKLHSFPELQDKELIRMNHGTSDSTIIDLEFGEDIIPTFPQAAVVTNALDSAALLFKGANGATRSFKTVGEIVLENALPRPMLFGKGNISNSEELTVKLSTLESMLVDESQEEFSTFVNYFTDFYQLAKQGQYGDFYRNGIISNQFITAFINSVESKVFYDLLYEIDRKKVFSYTTKNGTPTLARKEVFKHFIVRQNTIQGLLDGTGQFDFNHIKKKFYSYLYRDMTHQVILRVVGIPELTNPIVDVGFIGGRVIALNVRELRTALQEQHWLSGAYHILGYSHIINQSEGYSTVLRLVRLPIYNTGKFIV